MASLTIYLASTSPQRKKLLREARIRFRVVRPDYREENEGRGLPAGIVRRHALAKALSVAGKVRDGVVLGADTLVYCRGRIIGKPKDMADAFRILDFLQGRWQSVYTGVAILKLKDGKVNKKKVFSEKTRILLRSMKPREIKACFKRINPLNKAGAYAVQSKKDNFIQEIRGSFSNAVGLPVERLLAHFMIERPREMD